MHRTQSSEFVAPHRTLSSTPDRDAFQLPEAEGVGLERLRPIEGGASLHDKVLPISTRGEA